MIFSIIQGTTKVYIKLYEIQKQPIKKNFQCQSQWDQPEVCSSNSFWAMSSGTQHPLNKKLQNYGNVAQNFRGTSAKDLGILGCF